MNKLKVVLVLSVIFILVGLSFYWVANISDPTSIKSAAPPPLVPNIENEIQQLANLSNDRFCKSEYEKIQFHIQEYHNLGKLGKTATENNEWKNNLEVLLFAAYTDKFIKQADFIFIGSKWDISDLKFIQSETVRLSTSAFYVEDSQRALELTKIQFVLNKYNEISGFIAQCRNFKFTTNDLGVTFPITEVIRMINQAKALRQTQLQNPKVNNCVRLHQELKDIHRIFFLAHINYLKNKIDHWSGKYITYESQRKYNEDLYKPIMAELEAINNNIYGVSNFDSEHEALVKLWKSDGVNAMQHKYK